MSGVRDSLEFRRRIGADLDGLPAREEVPLLVNYRLGAPDRSPSWAMNEQPAFFSNLNPRTVIEWNE